MARPTKIRDAKSAQDFRDAVVERLKAIQRKARPALPVESPDEPVTPRVPPPRRGDSFRDFGPRRFFDNDDDN